MELDGYLWLVLPLSLLAGVPDIRVVAFEVNFSSPSHGLKQNTLDVTLCLKQNGRHGLLGSTSSVASTPLQV